MEFNEENHLTANKPCCLRGRHQSRYLLALYMEQLILDYICIIYNLYMDQLILDYRKIVHGVTFIDHTSYSLQQICHVAYVSVGKNIEGYLRSLVSVSNYVYTISAYIYLSKTTSTSMDDHSSQENKTNQNQTDTETTYENIVHVQMGMCPTSVPEDNSNTCCANPFTLYICAGYIFNVRDG